MIGALILWVLIGLVAAVITAVRTIRDPTAKWGNSDYYLFPAILIALVFMGPVSLFLVGVATGVERVLDVL